MNRHKIAALAASLMTAIAMTSPVNAAGKVTYKGNARRFISTNKTFFHGMNQMLPGDTYTGSAKVTNKTNRSVELFFRTKPSSKINEKMTKAMLKDFTLKVDVKKKSGTVKAYSGKWIGDSKNVSLGTYAAGETSTLKFKVTIPKTHENAFNMEGAAVDWIFSCKDNTAVPANENNPKQPSNPKAPSKNPSPSRNPSSPGTSSPSRLSPQRTSPKRNVSPSKRAHPAKTGDSTNIAAFIAVGAGAVAIILILTSKKRKNKNILKIMLIGIATAGVASGTVSTTSSYFTDGDDKNNELTIAHNTSTITENFPTGGDVQPNKTYTKEVSVANQESVGAWVRVHVGLSNSDMGQYISIDYNTNDWTKDGDYWYYNKWIKSGETTTPLFRHVSIGNIPDPHNYLVKDFEVITYEETVQNRNAKTNRPFGSAQEAFASIQ